MDLLALRKQYLPDHRLTVTQQVQVDGFLCKYTHMMEIHPAILSNLALGVAIILHIKTTDRFDFMLQLYFNDFARDVPAAERLHVAHDFFDELRWSREGGARKLVRKYDAVLRRELGKPLSFLQN